MKTHAVVVAGLGLGIVAVAPNYLHVQSAEDADAFRRTVDQDGAGRVAAAALIDVAFAAGYALFAATFRRHHALAALGAGVVTVAAAADIAENVLVVTGVRRGDRLSDGTVSTMRAFGRVKTIAFVAGWILVVADWLRGRLRTVAAQLL